MSDNNAAASAETWENLDKEIGNEFAPNNMETTPDAKLDEIDALLSGEPDKDTGTPKNKPVEQPADDDEDITEQPSAETAEDDADEDDAAEDEAKIDYEQLVPMPDNRDPMTVGQLKDAFTDMANQQQRIDQQNQDYYLKERQLISLAEYMQHADPKIASELAEIKQQRLNREQKLMAKALPEWQDATVQQRDIGTMKTTAQEYGFSIQEMESIEDSRLVKLLRDFSKLKASNAQALADARAKNPAKTPRGRKTYKTRNAKRTEAIQNAAASNDRAVKLDAIDNLIKGNL